MEKPSKRLKTDKVPTKSEESTQFNVPSPSNASSVGSKDAATSSLEQSNGSSFAPSFGSTFGSTFGADTTPYGLSVTDSYGLSGTGHDSSSFGAYGMANGATDTMNFLVPSIGSTHGGSAYASLGPTSYDGQSGGSTFYGSTDSSYGPSFDLQPSGGTMPPLPPLNNAPTGPSYNSYAMQPHDSTFFDPNAPSGSSFDPMAYDALNAPSSSTNAIVLAVSSPPSVGAYPSFNVDASVLFGGGSSYGTTSAAAETAITAAAPETTITAVITAKMSKAKCKQRLKRLDQAYSRKATLADLQAQVAANAGVELLTSAGILAMDKRALKSHLLRQGRAAADADSRGELQKQLAKAAGVALKSKKRSKAQSRAAMSRSVKETAQKQVKAGTHHKQAKNRTDGSKHPPTTFHDLMTNLTVDSVSEYILSTGRSALRVGIMAEAGKAYYGPNASQPGQRFQARLSDYKFNELRYDPGTGEDLRGPQVNAGKGGSPGYLYKTFVNDNWDGTRATATKMLYGGGMMDP